MTAVRVLIIDDSLTMRRLIALALAADPRIEVVGAACNTLQARRKIAELRPDVLTLDVEMPDETGLALLRDLMTTGPMPVLMVSSGTHEGSAAGIEALSLGAVDCVPKPAGAGAASSFAMLPDLVVAAAGAQVRPLAVPETGWPPGGQSSGLPGAFRWNGRAVMIAASTGGVAALQRLLSDYPADGPPTLIAQHMPGEFLASLAQRLNRAVAPRVTLAQDGQPLLRGHVLIAPGSDTHLVVASPTNPVCRLIAGDKRNGHRPSADALFDSAAAMGARAVGVILTGMGSDGAAGLLRMRQAGAVCIAQDRDSSVVWGMPRVAAELGAVDHQLPLAQIGQHVLRATSLSGAQGVLAPARAIGQRTSMR